MKRKPGTGSVTPTADGQFRARAPRQPDGTRPSIGVYPTEDEAEAMLAAAVTKIAEAHDRAPFAGVTLRAFGAHYLDELERGGRYPAIANARSIWKCWIAKAPFADLPLRLIRPESIQRWINDIGSKPKPGDFYLGQILAMLRKILTGAVGEGKLDANPAREVKLPPPRSRSDEPWTYLFPSEQVALYTCPQIPIFWRVQIEFAIYSGMRQGEQWGARLVDIRLDAADPHVVVRYGSKKRGPKGKKVRRCSLSPRAVAALERWLELLPDWCSSNPYGLIFPGPYGGHMKDAPEAWHSWIEAAGIKRYVRWHDLRHTCGASLVSGWWGKVWTLQQVRDQLGHWSIEETERYAHLAPGAVSAAAAATPGLATPLDDRGYEGSRTAAKTDFRVDDGIGEGSQASREVTPSSYPRAPHENPEALALAAERLGVQPRRRVALVVNGTFRRRRREAG